MKSTIELKQLAISTSLWTYHSGDVVPDRHPLSLTLTCDPTLVMINSDGMSNIFDYHALILEIDQIIKKKHSLRNARVAHFSNNVHLRLLRSNQSYWGVFKKATSHE